MDILEILWCLFWLCIYGALVLFIFWIIYSILGTMGYNPVIDPKILGLLRIAATILVVILLVTCVLGGGDIIPHPHPFWHHSP